MFYSAEIGSFASKFFKLIFPFYISGSILIKILIIETHVYHTTTNVQSNTEHLSVVLLSVISPLVLYGKRKYFESIYQRLNKISENVKTSSNHTFIIVKLLL